MIRRHQASQSRRGVSIAPPPRDPRVAAILNRLIIVPTVLFLEESDYAHLRYLYDHSLNKQVEIRISKPSAPGFSVTFEAEAHDAQPGDLFGPITLVKATTYGDTETPSRYPEIGRDIFNRSRFTIRLSLPKNVPAVPYVMPDFQSKDNETLLQDLLRIYYEFPQNTLAAQQAILERMKTWTGLSGIDVMFWYMWIEFRLFHLTRPQSLPCRLHIFLQPDDIYNPVDVSVQQLPQLSDPYVVIKTSSMPTIQFFQPDKLEDYPMIQTSTHGYEIEFPYSLVQYTNLIPRTSTHQATIFGGATLPETIAKVLDLFKQGYVATNRCVFPNPNDVEDYRIRLAHAFSTRWAVSQAYRFIGAPYLPGITVFDRPGPLTRLSQERQWRELCSNPEIPMDLLVPIAHELGLRPSPKLTKTELCRHIEQQYDRLFGETGRFLARPRSRVQVIV
jgi:hypothetical protein